MPVSVSDESEIVNSAPYQPEAMPSAPTSADDDAPAFGDCDDADPCMRRSDGVARHQGIEAEAEWRLDALSLRGSAMYIAATSAGNRTVSRFAATGCSSPDVPSPVPPVNEIRGGPPPSSPPLSGRSWPW